MLVIPGFGASDRSTVGLRSHLSVLGHPVHPWKLGRNQGPTAATLEGLGARFLELVERYERPIGLVGWSLGGVYSVAIARQWPEKVQAIITLGSPLRSAGADSSLPAVPVSSIWSRQDRIVRWPNAIIEEGDRRENIEVRATHLTLGFDPLALNAVADRLRQRPERWRPFRPAGWLAAAYPGETRPDRSRARSTNRRTSGSTGNER